MSLRIKESIISKVSNSQQLFRVNCFFLLISDIDIKIVVLYILSFFSKPHVVSEASLAKCPVL